MPDIRRKSHIEEPPSIKEELQRKAFEQLERLALQLERGEIGSAQFDTGVMTVWNCVSGLVDKNMMDLISEIQDHKESDAWEFVDRRVFTKDDNTAFFYRKYGGGTVIGKFERAGQVTYRPSYIFEDEICPSLAAKNKQDEITQLMINKGWKRRI